jgi:hypothetical protein
MQNYRELYNFLSLIDESSKAELIMGFGHYDLRIPEKCMHLFEDGFASQILFTGGIANGITAAVENESDITFLPEAHKDNLAENWRWPEQWIPHAGWFMLAKTTIELKDGNNLE